MISNSQHALALEECQGVVSMAQVRAHLPISLFQRVEGCEKSWT